MFTWWPIGLLTLLSFSQRRKRTSRWPTGPRKQHSSLAYLERAQLAWWRLSNPDDQAKHKAMDRQEVSKVVYDRQRHDGDGRGSVAQKLIQPQRKARGREPASRK